MGGDGVKWGGIGLYRAKWGWVLSVLTNFGLLFEGIWERIIENIIKDITIERITI